MEDLTGLGKMAEVIVGAFSKAIGSTLEPWQIRRVGKAEADVAAYKTLRLAQAEAKADLLRSGEALPTTRDRAAQRLVTQEMRYQTNLEAIAARASDNAEEAEANGAQARPIDEDWMNAFLTYAQHVGNEEIQKLWAKILTEQATEGKPVISKAALDCIRLIEPNQARHFEKALQLYLASQQIMDVRLEDHAEASFQINSLETLALEDLGLLKRVRDLEEHINVPGGMLTFWKSQAFVQGTLFELDQFKIGEPGVEITTSLENLWLAESSPINQRYLRTLYRIALGEEKDHNNLRLGLPLDRNILTSRGWEIGSIVVPTLYDLTAKSTLEETDLETLGPYADHAIRESIIEHWAKELSERGAAVFFSVPQPFSDHRKGSEVTGTRYVPTHLYNPSEEDWMDIAPYLEPAEFTQTPTT